MGGSNSSVRVSVFFGNDPRKRYRFLTIPLEYAGLNVNPVFVGNAYDLLNSLKNKNLNSGEDVFLSVGASPLLFFVFVYAKIKSIPFILRLGGNTNKDTFEVLREFFPKRPVLCLKAVINLFITRIMLKCVDSVVLVNDSLANELRKNINPKTKVWVVPQFGGKCEPRTEYRIRDRCQILTVANFRYEKKADGVCWLINALSSFVEETDEKIDFYVAGGGAFLEKIAEYSEKLQFPTGLTVNLLGYVDNVADLYRRADIFIYKSEHDATPNVILDAKRFGLPILMNKYPPFLALAVPNESALFYENSFDLQDQLNKVLKSKGLRQYLGVNGLVDYEEKFSVSSVSRELMKVLSVLNSKAN